MNRPDFRSITIIYSPYHAGIPDITVARGPAFLKNKGFLGQLQELGIPIHEAGIAPVEKEFDGDIARSFELFRRTSHLVLKAHDGKSFPIILAGNCSASVGVAAGLSQAMELLGKELACVWFDAHDDFSTPDILTSGSFDTMAITMMAGQCFKAMVYSVPGFMPFDLGRLVHVGMRNVNVAERQRVEEANLSVVWGSTKKHVNFEGGLRGYVKKKNLEKEPTLVHVDVDCLDTSIGRANHVAAPGGMFGQDLTGCLSMVASTMTPMALTIASFDPSLEGAGGLANTVIEAVVSFLQELLRSGKLGYEKQYQKG